MVFICFRKRLYSVLVERIDMETAMYLFLSGMLLVGQVVFIQGTKVK